MQRLPRPAGLLLHASFLRTAVLLALAGLAACGGDESAPPGSTSTPGGRAPEAGSAQPDDAGPLVIERTTHLLPPGHVDGGAGEGISTGVWFTEQNPRSKRAVDRHMKAFMLVRKQVGLKYRDSRRSVVINVLSAKKWRSPEVILPESASLQFSYRPELSGMGGFTSVLDWQVEFEVSGKRDGVPAATVPVWSRANVFLRPPSGGNWKDVRVDLAEIGGRRGRFVFSAVPPEGAPTPDTLVAAFGNPTVVPEGDDRPNVVVISIDTLRRDVLSPYGADPATTPAIQRLADSGVVLDNFWSTAPWTLPAYASLMTGEYPSTHGAGLDREGLENLGDKPRGDVGQHRVKSIASGIPSLVTHFAEHGYATQGFYSNGHLNLKSGVERGFDGYVWYGATGHMAADSFDTFARSVEGRPFFAFVQMLDPHWPYALPDRFAEGVSPPDTSDNESMNGKPIEMFIDGVPVEDRQDFAELYDLLVKYTDLQVEALMESLERRGLRDNTLVVFHVDHGEELWDHGEWWHGHTHFRELVHLPAFFSFPGRLPAGTRMAEQMRAIDVLPTIIDLVGLPAPEHETEGTSLAHFLRGEDGPTPPPALHESELYGPGGDFGLTEYPWRLLVQPLARWVDREAWEAAESLEDEAAREAALAELEKREVVMLFNIEEDPEEQVNLADEHPERVADMRRRADAILARAAERRSGVSETTEMGADADAGAALEALGYAGTY